MQELTKLNVNFKTCCNGCDFGEPYSNILKKSLLDGQVVIEERTVGCRHEKVCKEYRESEE